MVAGFFGRDTCTLVVPLLLEPSSLNAENHHGN